MLKLDFQVGRSIRMRTFPQIPGESSQIYVGHNVSAKIPKIDTTNRIKPTSRCHPECKFIAFNALMRYGIKHRKTTTAGSEIIKILLIYCIKSVMSRPP